MKTISSENNDVYLSRFVCEREEEWIAHATVDRAVVLVAARLFYHFSFRFFRIQFFTWFHIFIADFFLVSSIQLVRLNVHDEPQNGNIDAYHLA